MWFFFSPQDPNSPLSVCSDKNALPLLSSIAWGYKGRKTHDTSGCFIYRQPVTEVVEKWIYVTEDAFFTLASQNHALLLW